MNKAYPAGAFFKGRTVVPGPIERKARRAKKADALQTAYASVDARDKKRCQVTGKALSVGGVDEWTRLERNHLGPRSTRPEDRANADNILTVSAAVHKLMQAWALIPVDAKGDRTERVSKIAGYRWNRAMVPVGKEPFRLKSRKVA